MISLSFSFRRARRSRFRRRSGSNSVTVISGPRILQGGDVVWSDAFPFGSTVWSYHSGGADLGVTPPGTTTPYQVTMTGPTNGPDYFRNATVTHAPGSGGQSMGSCLRMRSAARLFRQRG